MTKVLTLSFLCGIVGTFCGGLFVFLPSKNGEKFQNFALGLASGFMLVMVLFDIIPQIVVQTNLWIGLLGIAFGILLICFLNIELKQPKIQRILTKHNHNSNAFDAIALLLAIGLHNLPEGMAIGTMEIVDKSFEFAILMTIHNIPEGMAVAAMLSTSGYKKSKSAILAALSGAPTVLGAVIGHFVGVQSKFLMSISLGIAAGAMLVIIFADILPTSFASGKKYSVASANIAGIILGLAIVVSI